MFSTKPAPKALLLIPLALLVLVISLGLAVIQNPRSTATTTTPPAAAPQQTNNTPTPPANNPQPSNNGSNNNSNGGSKNSDAVSKPPVGFYPDNKCPEALVKEGANSFAIDAGEKYSLSGSNATWIAANCPDVETLTF